MSLLRIDELTVDLPTADGTFRVLERQSLEVAAGTILGVVGESGSGKTMLLRAIKGILPEGATRTWAHAEFDGEAVDDTARLPISMVFQDPLTSFNPLMRVGSHLVEVVRRHRRLSRAAARERALEALAAARVPDPERVFGRYPHELSGGLRQRAMIAMGLLAEPRLLLADEPTTALDATVQAEILALIRQLRDERQLTVLLVTHDLGVVAAVCDEVAVMKDGEIVERGTVDAVFAEPRHPYTRSLLAAAPDRGDL
jgi:ABC-type dipeptide/oligopeptide/nickel transport system ATPase component